MRHFPAQIGLGFGGEAAVATAGETLKDRIYALLAADAQLTAEGRLGNILGLSSSEPYGIYFRNPPEGIDFDVYTIITYFVNSMAGRWPRDVYVSITAWGKDFEAALNRCFVLLHGANLDTSDYHFLMLKFDSALSENFAEDLKTYYQQHRYLAKVIKT